MTPGAQALEPLNFFDGVEFDRAVRALQRYLRAYPSTPKREFTGRYFEQFASTTDTFVSNDIVALTMLAAGMPPSASARLVLDRERFYTRVLAAIPHDLEIWDGDEGLSESGYAMVLWDTVISLGGVGPTKTSKLLAAKRPRLVPIHDSKVGAALYPHIDPFGRRFVRESWELWRAWARGTEGKTLRVAAEEVALAAAGEPGIGSTRLSSLRVIDIVMWTRLYIQERIRQGRVKDFVELEDFGNEIGT